MSALVRRRTVQMLAAVLLGWAASATADESALARCRKIPEAAQRLACYDAIVPPAPLAARGAASAVAATPSAAPPAAPSAATPAAPAAAAATKPPVAPAPAGASSAASRADAERDFGAPAKPDEIEFIDSTLVEPVDSWRANTRFRLANGQVWQVADDSSGVLRAGARKVRVRRGALGAFFMEFENTNRSPRVRRVQ